MRGGGASPRVGSASAPGASNSTKSNSPVLWNVAEEYPKWIRHGVGLGATASAPGEFSIVPAGGRIVEGIYGAGAHTALLSRRHNGVLQSPRFKIETNNISFRVQGGNFSVVRLIVENYAVPRSGIYHQRYSPKKDEPVWYTWDTTYWKGFTAYVEFATLDDATNFLLDKIDSRKEPRPQPVRDGRSFFGATAVAFHDGRMLPENLSPAVAYLLQGSPPDDARGLARLYAERLKTAAASWRRGEMKRRAGGLPGFLRAQQAVARDHARQRRAAQVDGRVPPPGRRGAHLPAGARRG